jgi:hypothetical protein
VALTGLERRAGNLANITLKAVLPAESWMVGEVALNFSVRPTSLRSRGPIHSGDERRRRVHGGVVGVAVEALRPRLAAPGQLVAGCWAADDRV